MFDFEKEVNDFQFEVKQKLENLENKLQLKFDELYSDYVNDSKVLNFKPIEDYKNQVVINQLQYGLFYTPQNFSTSQNLYNFKDLSLELKVQVLNMLSQKRFVLK